MVHGLEHPPFEELAAASDPYPVSVVGGPVTDTCKEVVDGVVRRTLARETLVEARGPWVFSREDLADALGRVKGQEHQIGDLMEFCEKAQLRVRVLAGPWNPVGAAS